jgi:7-cyano-7-deazaguanine synthase
MNKEPAIVVLLSGGLDSSVLIHYLRAERPTSAIHALSFNYGQRHSRELDASRFQAGAAGTAIHKIIDISFLGDLLKEGSALLAGGEEVPDLVDLEEDDLSQPPTYVPNRNMMLLSMAAAFAEAQGSHDVFYGAQAQDEYGYWDCTTAFLDKINATLALNRKQPVTVHAPFVNWSKADIVRRGLELNVDLSQTWSCYRGGDAPCGTCPTCVERLTAFRECAVTDPLPYMQK